MAHITRGVFNKRGHPMNGKRLKLVIQWIGMAAALAAVFTTPVQAKEWKTVTVAFEYGHAPWAYNYPKDRDVEMHGFEPELLADLCERAKLQCTQAAAEWKELIPGLQTGKFDVVMDALSITSQLKKVIAFSKAVHHRARDLCRGGLEYPAQAGPQCADPGADRRSRH